MALKKEIENTNIYIYGMTVMSTIHLLGGAYPEEDTYQEIQETHHVPGGETCNSAIVLAALGHQVKIDGPYLGRDSKAGIEEFCSRFSIDCSNMTYDEAFSGVKDVVLVGNNTRTVFGWFGKYFSDEVRRWTKPDFAAIDKAKVVGLDPYFPESSEAVAQYCAQTGKAYVSIDSAYDSVISQNSTAIIISKEYIKNTYPNVEVQALMALYQEHCKGLIVFTFGAKQILYARQKSTIKQMPTFKVEVKSTLGAGDTFRGGILHGIYEGYSDEETVRFASALAACVISRFPMALNPPTMEEVREMMASR